MTPTQQVVVIMGLVAMQTANTYAWARGWWDVQWRILAMQTMVLAAIVVCR